MKIPHLLGTLTLLAVGATSAAAQNAQNVSLEFQDGQVRLQAQGVSVSQILAEWGRRGRTTIVNGERVPGPAVTIELQNVPEQQALEIVLRSVSGYLVAPRETAIAGASVYDRIYILPTSSRPTNASPLPPQQQQQQQQQQQALQQDDLDDDPPPGPGPGGVRGINPGARLPRDVAGRPAALDQDDNNEPENRPPFTNPFAPGTVRPGVVTPGTPSPTPPGALTPAIPAPNTPGMITPAPSNRPNNQ